MSAPSTLPVRVGITGGIGSGKSLVCRIFSCLGIPVYEADTRAKWLTNHDPGIRNKVIALLGEKAYDARGQYDRAYVSSKVFNDQELLTKLNGIIHPAVMQDTLLWMENHSDSLYLIKEAAIMKAASEDNALDFVVVVEAPADIRIQRILKRDNRTEQDILAIMERQVSDEERGRIADFKINNDGRVPLIPQVLKLHEFFREQQRNNS
ncbi:Dephospho-CoA kinase [Dyadobacter sp. CECT 9275]|uniref:Dephospho-CoA kinase n=1 Tax=Dyadobacter helix TaxID=2822344 RepID=A0A916NM24_9BACT|nr:dephospho-CoA kinase [Dyadobacter sp. CECT 9275]CAG5003955.1 Dephospho-CoA kinase [Dyadobacter sp. CECT 9275]